MSETTDRTRRGGSSARENRRRRRAGEGEGAGGGRRPGSRPRRGRPAFDPGRRAGRQRGAGAAAGLGSCARTATSRSPRAWSRSPSASRAPAAGCASPTATDPARRRGLRPPQPAGRHRRRHRRRLRGLAAAEGLEPSSLRGEPRELERQRPRRAQPRDAPREGRTRTRTQRRHAGHDAADRGTERHHAAGADHRLARARRPVMTAHDTTPEASCASARSPTS